jgi:hypothetical protein
MESKRCIWRSKLKNGSHELMMIRDDDTGMASTLGGNGFRHGRTLLRVSEWW